MFSLHNSEVPAREPQVAPAEPVPHLKLGRRGRVAELSQDSSLAASTSHLKEKHSKCVDYQQHVYGHSPKHTTQEATTIPTSPKLFPRRLMCWISSGSRLPSVLEDECVWSLVLLLQTKSPSLALAVLLAVSSSFRLFMLKTLPVRLVLTF